MISITSFKLKINTINSHKIVHASFSLQNIIFTPGFAQNLVDNDIIEEDYNIEGQQEFHDEYEDEYIEDFEITDEQIRELVKIGPPILTRFEKARILGARALQISMGAPPLIEIEEERDKEMTDPLLIATAELEAKVLPISVRRFLPDGRFQDIPLQYLYLDWSRKTTRR